VLSLQIADGLSAMGVGRPVNLRATGAVIEVHVVAHTIYRYGINVDAGGNWLELEYDAEGFCLCRATASGWQTDWIAGPGIPGEVYSMRLTIEPGGIALGQVFDSEGNLLGSGEVYDTLVDPAAVDAAWIGVWSDTPSDPRSDYDTLDISIGSLPR
jgi:hypothetical protein